MAIRHRLQVSAMALMALGLSACGGGGSSSSNTPPPPPPVADTISPSVAFSPTTLTVDGGSSGTSNLTSSDNVGVSSGPTTTCTNGGVFSGGTFTAPNVASSTVSQCTATVSDAAGNSSTATLTVTINPESTAPTIAFTPASLSIVAGSSGLSNLTASDNTGVTSGPTTTCTNGGVFSGGTFTAPLVTTTTVSECTATASDAAGNSSTASLSVTIAPDTSAPTLSFTPTALTVVGGSTGTSTLSVSDNSGAILSPTFSCTNGGSFSGTTFTAPAVTAETNVVCTATAVDASGNSGTAELTATVTQAPESVTVSGSITFDHVPFDTSDSSLDFDNITQDPAPGVTVEALNSAGTVIDTTVTDGNGDYSFLMEPNTEMRIRVKAEMVQTSGAQWNVRVVDNTSSGALYTFQGSLANVGLVDSVRDLNAASGWGGSSYTSDRVAGPFAILAPIYESLIRIAAIDSDVVFPFIDFNWSENNRPGMNSNLSFLQNIANGDIGTSSYVSSSDGDRRVLILGDANNDTDEYDEHVVIHEWGHYFEDQLSRSDSIGGLHGLGDRLDPRVALSEGFGNAVSGMMTDDPFYRDSFGFAQGQGFFINVENNNNQNEGWYNEGSTQSILYDIFDSVDDGGDTISAGLGPIYEAFTDAAYTGSNLFTTIFLFVDVYNANNAVDASAVNALNAEQSINGTGEAGIGETNNGIVSTSLPIYNNATVNGGAIEICTNDVNGDFNKLGNRTYVVFNVTSAGAHTLRMNRTSGVSSTDPDFFTHRDGVLLAIAESGANNTETDVVNLNIGQHIVDAFDFNNGDACYDFSITR